MQSSHDAWLKSRLSPCVRESGQAPSGAALGLTLKLKMGCTLEQVTVRGKVARVPPASESGSKNILVGLITDYGLGPSDTMLSHDHPLASFTRTWNVVYYESQFEVGCSFCGVSMRRQDELLAFLPCSFYEVRVVLLRLISAYGH